MTERQLGIGLGMLTGLLVGLLVVVLLFRMRVLDCTFDERQERARGKAFKYGFFTLLISIFLYGCSELVLGRWCDALAGGSICVGLGMTVFAVVCIWKDAYLSLRERPGRVVPMMLMIGLGNLAISVTRILDGGLLENGILTFRAANLILGVMVLVILAAYLVSALVRGRGEGE